MKVPPPIIMFVLVALQWLLEKFFPIVRFEGSVYDLIGASLVALGVLIALIALTQFANSRTTLNPFGKPSKFIKNGIYRYSRNPMYVALTSLLAGTSFILGAVSCIIMPIVFVVIINRTYIAPEELNMSELFGNDYKTYTKRTRRWL